MLETTTSDKVINDLVNITHNKHVGHDKNIPKNVPVKTSPHL